MAIRTSQVDPSGVDPELVRPIRPEDARPPLRWYSQLWRFAVCLLLSASVWGPSVFTEWRDHRTLFYLDVGLGVTAYVLAFTLRRRFPSTVALLTNAMTAVSGIAAGPSTLAAVSMATLRKPVPILAVALTMVSAGMLYTTVIPDQEITPAWIGPVLQILVTGVILGWGLFIGSRRQLLATLRQRAMRAEAEQEWRAQQAQSDERGRIAREMHDVLAHRISQISMQAGALGFRDDLDVDALRTGIGQIQQNANTALDELRDVLGVLRDGSGELANRPQPTYHDLADLVAESSAGGANVELVDSLAGTPPDVLGRTIYRVVQEGITNAGKHAPGSRLSILLSGDHESGIDLELRNPIGFARTARVPSAGVGLIGMSERVELRGGTLEHTLADGWFRLRVWLPWTP